MKPSGPLGRAIAIGDHAFVSGFLFGRFGVSVETERIKTWLKRPCGGTSGNWLDHSWTSWFKRRLEDDGNFCPRGDSSDISHFSTDLHMGFVAILETEGQLICLRREKTPVCAGPTTPAIERTMNMPQPIDRVAARVVTGAHS